MYRRDRTPAVELPPDPEAICGLDLASLGFTRIDDCLDQARQHARQLASYLGSAVVGGGEPLRALVFSTPKSFASDEPGFVGSLYVGWVDHRGGSLVKALEAEAARIEPVVEQDEVDAIADALTQSLLASRQMGKKPAGGPRGRNRK